MKKIVLNPSTCACDCDSDCYMGEYLKDCGCMKSLVDGLLVTSAEIIVDAPESAPINPSDGIKYWFIAVVLLTFVCKLLLLVIDVKYCMKHELTILFLLS